MEKYNRSRRKARGYGTVPTIEIDVAERVSRHLSAVRLMSYMVFPDDSKLRAAAEITFRTILADWYSGAFLKQDRKTQQRVVRRMRVKLGEELPRALADPPAWVRNKIFELFLKPVGGIYQGALTLTGSPSADELEREWTSRWWSIIYTGKLIALIGSINQHHLEAEASVNKAIHILCETEGNDRERMSSFRQCGFPGVYGSSLKKAWAKFRPVAHLCGAYVTTETHYYEGELSRDFWEYWKLPLPFTMTRRSECSAFSPSLPRSSQLLSCRVVRDGL
jgi:hypothetical protein